MPRIASIAEQWTEFAESVLDDECPNIQRQEMRRAFYAGCRSFLTALTIGLEPGTEATDADLRRLDEIDAELKQFVEDVRTGRA